MSHSSRYLWTGGELFIEITLKKHKKKRIDDIQLFYYLQLMSFFFKFGRPG